MPQNCLHNDKFGENWLHNLQKNTSRKSFEDNEEYLEENQEDFNFLNINHENLLVHRFNYLGSSDSEDSESEL